MMKKLFLLAILMLPWLLSAQSDRKVDAQGGLLYQYSRTSELNPQNPSERIVTFVFVNGNAQRAVTFRQESIEGTVRWIDTEGGETGTETIVDFVTANLAPGQTVAWKYAFAPKTGTAPAALERAALLIMEEDFGTEKIMLK
jgi:hypothetical protein